MGRGSDQVMRLVENNDAVLPLDAFQRLALLLLQKVVVGHEEDVRAGVQLPRDVVRTPGTAPHRRKEQRVGWVCEWAGG